MPHTANPAIKPLFSLAMAPMFGKREDWAGDFAASRALTTAGGLNPEGEEGASRRSVGYGETRFSTRQGEGEGEIDREGLRNQPAREPKSGIWSCVVAAAGCPMLLLCDCTY